MGVTNQQQQLMKGAGDSNRIWKDVMQMEGDYQSKGV